jgi:hypothetical protein
MLNNFPGGNTQGLSRCVEVGCGLGAEAQAHFLDLNLPSRTAPTLSLANTGILWDCQGFTSRLK